MTLSLDIFDWNSTNEEILRKEFPSHRACRDGDVIALTTALAVNASHAEREDVFYAWTAAHWASYFGKLSCLRKAVKQRPDLVNAKTSRCRQTPCHVASFACNTHCLYWLLQTDALVDQKDYLGETPLHKAAYTGSIECIRVLLAHQADLATCNNNGQTAAEVAQARGFTECADYLSRQVQVRTTTPHGVYPPWRALLDLRGESRASGSSDTARSPPPTSGDATKNQDVGEVVDVLLVPGVDSNSVAVAGVKRGREDEESICWMKIKLGGSECDVCKDRSRVNSILLSYNAVLSASVKPLRLDSNVRPLTKISSSGRLFF